MGKKTSTKCSLCLGTPDYKQSNFLHTYFDVRRWKGSACWQCCKGIEGTGGRLTEKGRTLRNSLLLLCTDLTFVLNLQKRYFKEWLLFSDDLIFFE